MDSNLNAKNKIIQSKKNEQEIDIKIILNFLIRNKKIIVFFINFLNFRLLFSLFYQRKPGKDSFKSF